MTTVRDTTTARRDDRAAVGWAWTGRNLTLDEALLTVYIYRPETLYITQNKHGMLFTGTRIHIVPNFAYLRGDLPTRVAVANHHKPPPKRHKYAGFETMGIPESMVLHRYGLASLKESKSES